MEVNDFELPIEGLIKKFNLFLPVQEEKQNTVTLNKKTKQKPLKSLQKDKKPVSKKKK